jgi:hypothetical protein
VCRFLEGDHEGFAYPGAGLRHCRAIPGVSAGSAPHHPLGDWDLIVTADTKEILRKTVGKTTTTNGWLDVSVDLSEYQGKSILLELYNQPTGWNFENGYWEKIVIELK